MASYNVAIVGATGMVGQKMAQVLEERQFPYSNLKMLASFRSAGSTVKVGNREYTVEEVSPEAFEGLDFAFFSAGGDISEQFAPEAAKKGAVVIDNSSAFRMHDDVPLVVPEVNPGAVKKHRGIIANPNCSTIQMVVVLQALHQEAGIERVVVSTYQAVSGAGKEAMDELEDQSKAYLEGQEVKAEYIPHKGAARNYQIAYNVVPQLDVFDEDGYTKEEMKMIKETRKIMELPELRVTATTVRGPIFNGHSESVNIEFTRDITPERAREVLSGVPGVVIQDDPSQLIYPMPIHADGYDEIFVGRIRKDRSTDKALNLWIVSDNLRKGAATNSVQIAELLV